MKLMVPGVCIIACNKEARLERTNDFRLEEATHSVLLGTKREEMVNCCLTVEQAAGIHCARSGQTPCLELDRRVLLEGISFGRWRYKNVFNANVCREARDWTGSVLQHAFGKQTHQSISDRAIRASNELSFPF